MKVTVRCGPDVVEEEVVIRCRQVGDTVMKIAALAGAAGKKLTGSIGREIFVLDTGSVLYFESVDDRVFIYTKDKVYDCALRLYEIEREFAGTDLIRANKSTIINLARVKSLNPILNGKIEVTLENGEKQLFSRQYAPALKEKLGIGR